MIHEDFYGDQFKWYIGVVREVDSDRNRVRVRIFGIHHMEDKTNVSDGDLPYATVLYPTTGAQGSGGNMSHNLKPGAWVMGFFADGDDCQQPFIVGVIDGGSGSTSGAGSGSGGGRGDAGVENTGETINIPGNGNLEKAYNFFRKKIEDSGRSSGDVHAQVSGMLGNFMHESASDNLNIRASNPGDGRDGSTSIGIAQWNSDRSRRLRATYGENPNLEQQLSWVWHELNTSHTKARNALLTSKNVSEATAAMLHYEIPKGYSASAFDPTKVSGWNDRLQRAYKVYNSMKYTPADSRSRQQVTQ